VILDGSKRERILVAGIALLLSGCNPLAAEKAPAASQHDLTGMWRFDFPPKAKEEAPLTPAAAAALQAHKDAQAHGQVRSAANMKCLPPGMPVMMELRPLVQFVQTPTRVIVLSENSPIPRYIYMNQKEQPKDVDPSWNGHSIGKWDGNTLVVDTVSFEERSNRINLAGITHSPMLHISERIHLEEGGQVLYDDMTFDDPATFTKPWTTTYKYTRMPDTEESLESVCEVDLEALDQLKAAGLPTD
jgi:hypothetical protein